MEKFIPYEKLSKKEKRKIDAQRRSQFAKVNMTQRTAENKKKYDRNKQKSRRDYNSSEIFILPKSLSIKT